MSIFSNSELEALERRKNGVLSDSSGIFSARIKPKIKEILEIWLPQEEFLRKMIEQKPSLDKVMQDPKTMLSALLQATVDQSYQTNKEIWEKVHKIIKKRHQEYTKKGKLISQERCIKLLKGVIKDIRKRDPSIYHYCLEVSIKDNKTKISRRNIK